MEKKENTGTKLNVLLCNLVDYVRGDDRPLVFAVMQEITEYFDQELDKAREEGRREILEQFKNYWDNDYLGDYPKFGNAGIGMIKGEMRDYINEELSKLKQ